MQYSIIKKSELERALRMDAEYYQPEYLDVKKKLNTIKTESFENLAESILSFGAYSLTSNIEWKKDGVPYVNVGDIHDGFIDYTNVKYISEKVDKILHKSQLKEKDIVLTMAGTIGNAAVVHNIQNNHINGNQAIAKIKLKKNISPYYITAFLNSRYGQLQTLREVVSSVQANIFLGPIKKFKIPIFHENDSKKVESLYKKFLNELEKSKHFYSQAENLLLEEVGVEKDISSYHIFSIVNFSQIQKANRMDAEYFQPGPFQFGELVSVTDFKTQPLSDFVDMKKGFEPGSEAYQEEGKLFIRVSSLSKEGITDKDQKYLSEKLYQELKKDYEPKKGEILLTKDATPGIAYVLKEPIEGLVAGGVMRLKLKEDIEPEYLALCINSSIGQMQVQRDAGGSIIKHWKPSQIKTMLIPTAAKPTQEKIANLVRKSHEARKKSKELLEEAKRKVEELIEGNHQ